MRSMGRWGRLVVSASCSLVGSFSLAKSSLRAASHSWREVTAGRLIAHLLSGRSGPEGPLNYPTNATAADGQPAPRAANPTSCTFGNRKPGKPLPAAQEGADLDRPPPSSRMARRNVDGFIPVGTLDHVVSGDLLLCLGERAVRDQQVAPADAYRHRVTGRAQAVAMQS